MMYDDDKLRIKDLKKFIAAYPVMFETIEYAVACGHQIKYTGDASIGIPKIWAIYPISSFRFYVKSHYSKFREELLKFMVQGERTIDVKKRREYFVLFDDLDMFVEKINHKEDGIKFHLSRIFVSTMRNFVNSDAYPKWLVKMNKNK